MTKLKSRKLKVALVVMGALLICGLGSFLGISLLGDRGSVGVNLAARATDTLSLTRPVFAQETGTTFLEEEAGMSLYTDIGQPLDLSLARNVYKTIEKETADYIVGSLALPNLPETEDIHCFVHKDGWIAAYYLSEEPASKVIDWSYYSAGDLTKTKLQVGLEEICNPLGVTATSANYYHFQYPYASKWMIIVESATTTEEDSFTLKIPSSFTVYERSWSHYASGCTSRFKIDGTTINIVAGGTSYDGLTAAQLSLDIFHTVSTGFDSGSSSGQRYIAIILLYLEP